MYMPVEFRSVTQTESDTITLNRVEFRMLLSKIRNLFADVKDIDTDSIKDVTEFFAQGKETIMDVYDHAFGMKEK